MREQTLDHGRGGRRLIVAKSEYTRLDRREIVEGRAFRAERRLREQAVHEQPEADAAGARFLAAAARARRPSRISES